MTVSVDPVKVGVGLAVAALLSGASGSQTGLTISPTVNQSGSAGYKALLVNPTQTAVGSGSKMLAQFCTSDVQRAVIDNGGYALFGGTTMPNSTLESAGSFGIQIGTIATDFTAGANGALLANCAAGQVTITLPDAATCARRVYFLQKIDATANPLVIDPNGAQLIDFALTKTTTAQGASLIAITNGVAWYVFAVKGTWT